MADRHHTPTGRTGVQELREDAERYLDLVRAGQTIEVTDGGEPVAHLTPVPKERPLVRLRGEGRLTPATESLSDLPPPVSAPDGAGTLSAELMRMRDDERY